MNEPSPTKRQIRTLRVLLRQYGIEEGLTEAIKLWMAIHWVGVPWCDKHNAEWRTWSGIREDGSAVEGCLVRQLSCRLEEPARHYVVREAE